MNDKETSKPRALVLEGLENIRGYVEKILSLAGWETLGIEDSEEVPRILKNNLSHPFALFICNYDKSAGQDENLLKKVRTISPITQRVILIQESHIPSLGQVVNKIGIRACITVPFTPKELVQHVRSCLKYFSKLSKRGRMHRIIAHQNRQLYRVAKKMQEKEGLLTRLIQEKTFQKQVLDRVDSQGQCSLKERMAYHDIPMTPENLSREYSGLEKMLVRLFEQAAREMRLQLPKKEEIQDLSQISSDPHLMDLADTIVQTLMGSVPDFCLESGNEDSQGMVPQDLDNVDEPSPLDPFFHVRISKDQLMAFIEKSDGISSMEESVSLVQLLEFLRTKRISYGIAPDKVLESWLKTAEINEPLQVAQGSSPIVGQNGKVIYYFENMSVQAGAIHEDGSIDFKERTNIPHVSRDGLLAKKIPAVQGSEGITVSGTPIPIPEVIDPGFKIKSNAYFSEDELSIFSSIDGQPHVNALGEISVNPEIVIKGDVGYETGNIDFDGNVIVRGVIQEGFRVQCVNLVAEGIQGANIFITGDLTVGAGITESEINAAGHVKAKFVNRSSVVTFGDVTVQKEILDSQIVLGGVCNNSTGHIIASKVVARGGVDAGKIDTHASAPCSIHVGGDKFVRIRQAALTSQIEKIQAQYQSVGKSMDEVEIRDQELYPMIIRKTHDQESISALLHDAKYKLARANAASVPKSYISRLGEEIKKLEKKKSIVEKDLDQLFGLQDTYVKHIENLKQSYENLKSKEKKLASQLQEIEQFEKNSPVVPELVVHRTITRKTNVQGISASLILDREQSACRIQEVRKKDRQSGKVYSYMVINEL